MRRVALIVGHTAKAQGATNYLGESEYRFNTRIANAVKRHVDIMQSDLHLEVWYRDDGWAAVQAKAEEFKPSMTVELHFNAADGIAYGTEILVYKGASRFEDIVRIADEMTDRLADMFSLKERHTFKLDDDSMADGVKVMSSGRGVGNLKYMHQAGVPIVMLIEPVFGDKKQKESEKFFLHEELYVQFLVDSFLKHAPNKLIA